MKTSKVFSKLATGIAILILIIEGALLVVSVSKKERDLITLQKLELDHHGSNKLITNNFVEYELNKFSKNVLYLTLVISIFVISGTSFIYYNIVGKYLSKITKHNRTNSSLDPNFIAKSLPNDEIGELILSREKMLKSLENKIDENKALTRMLAHDIGNALTVVIGNTDSLLKQVERNELDFLGYKLNKISKASIAQKNLIERVRHLEAIGSNKTEIVLNQFSLNELLRDSIELFEDRLEEKKVKINFAPKIPDSTKAYADDILLLNNVINNLISNAIKFSHKHSAIEISSFQDKKSTISFEIKDNGIGIPKELISKVFLPNIKTNRIGTNGETGTGFGLPLAFSTINLLNGKIKVASKSIEEHPTDHWTKFQIDLPQLES